jgi:hypothetical protein
MEVLLDVTVSPSASGARREAPAGPDDLARIARFLVRQRIAHAVATAQQRLEGFSELGAVLVEFEPRFRRLLHEAPDPGALLAAQEEALGIGGVLLEGPDLLLFRSRGGVLEVSVRLEAQEEGSLFQRVRVYVAGKGEKLAWNVLANLLSALILGSVFLPSPVPTAAPDHPPAYVCTLDGYVAESPERLIEEQVERLLFVDDGSEAYRPEVENWQVCLLAAGYHPGPIDGRLGPRTREAIEAFAADTGVARPDTANRVFARLLLSRTLSFARTQMTARR